MSRRLVATRSLGPALSGLVVALGLVGPGCGDGVIRRVDDPLELNLQSIASPGQGFLQIQCVPSDVEIFVDGRFHGLLHGYNQGVVRLPRGPHRLTLAKAGFYNFHRLIEIGPEAIEISTYLVAEVDNADNAIVVDD